MNSQIQDLIKSLMQDDAEFSENQNIAKQLADQYIGYIEQMRVIEEIISEEIYGQLEEMKETSGGSWEYLEKAKDTYQDVLDRWGMNNAKDDLYALEIIKRSTIANKQEHIETLEKRINKHFDK